MLYVLWWAADGVVDRLSSIPNRCSVYEMFLLVPMLVATCQLQPIPWCGLPGTMDVHVSHSDPALRVLSRTGRWFVPRRSTRTRRYPNLVQPNLRVTRHPHPAHTPTPWTYWYKSTPSKFGPCCGVHCRYYTEWGLQRDAVWCDGSGVPCGVRVWTSNWVPSLWSVREFWPGDNYALALAYFKTGMADAGTVRSAMGTCDATTPTRTTP